MYKKNPFYTNQIPTGSTENEQVAFLFETVASQLEKAWRDYKAKNFESYAQTIQQPINLLVSLSGILSPYNTLKQVDAEGEPTSLQEEDSPWDDYFMRIFYSISNITDKFDEEMAGNVCESLREMAALWRQNKEEPSTDGAATATSTEKEANTGLNAEC